MAIQDALDVARQRGRSWLPARRLRTLKAAGRFLDQVGFALLFPADPITAPSLFEAVAGPDVVPWAAGMGQAEGLVWQWKDALPEAGLAWYGKLLHRRASLLSPGLLALLYPGDGEPTDHEAFELLPDAHRIAEALIGGALPSSALRELVGDRGRYDRAVTQLQSHLLVTSAGVREQRSGWPATLLDLTCRLFDVGGGADHAEATRRYLDTMIQARPVQLARAFGWPTAVARTRLDQLVADGAAEVAAGVYGRPAEAA